MLEMLKDNLLTSLTSSNFSITQLIVAISLSLVASVAVYIIYQLFYGSRNIGAGVDRSFIVAGPAITALFLGIQSSIPLSLGLLGALSFVRFRTPVKDPAEIGYLLLLIATSIGAATQTYLIAVVLFIAIFLALCVQWLIQNRFSFSAPMNFMITIDKQVFSEIENKLSQFLESRLDNLQLKTMSVQDDRVSIHYQHTKMPTVNKAEFIAELNRIAGPGEIDFFSG